MPGHRIVAMVVLLSFLAPVAASADAQATEPLHATLEFSVDPNTYDNVVHVSSGSEIAFPRVLVDSSPASPYRNTVYIVGLTMRNATTCWNPVVVRSIDGGRTFGPREIASTCVGSLSDAGQYPTDVALGRNGVLTMALERSNTTYRSTDGGTTWESVQVLSGRVSAFSLASDPVTGALFAAGIVGQGLVQVNASLQLVVTVSPDGGSTWGSPIALDLQGAFPLPIPRIAARGGSAVVGVQLFNASGTYIATAVSSDGGSSWSTPRALSAVANSSQTLLSATASPGGEFSVAWLGAKEPTSCSDLGCTRTKVYVSLSGDGGESFTAPVQVGTTTNPHGEGVVGGASTFDSWSRIHIAWHGVSNTSPEVGQVFVSSSSGPAGAFEEASFSTALQFAGGNYTVLESLAAGLNGTVYLAWYVGYYDLNGTANLTSSGVFIRTVTGVASGDVRDDAHVLAGGPTEIQLRDVDTQAVRVRMPWNGSAVTLEEVPSGNYAVWITDGSDASLAGTMPVDAWGQTTFVIHVDSSAGFPWAIVAGGMGAIAVASAVLVALHYSRLAKEEVLQREVRRLLYRYVVGNPGSSFTAVRDAVGLQNGVASYHLGVLEKQGLIHSEARRRHRWYYPNGDVSLWRDLPLSPLQKSIIAQVQRTPGLGIREMARGLNRHTATVAYNVRALEQEDLLRTERKGLKTRCFLSENPEAA